MKKLLTLAAVATALAVCALSAKASIGITTNYTPLNVSFTIITNSLPVTNSAGVVTTTTGKVKMDNATLLNIFAHWATNTWPAGAKLVLGWDAPWDGDPLVVDKSGTNVLYDTHETGGEAVFLVPLQFQGSISEKSDPTNAAGSYTETVYCGSVCIFEDDGLYLTDTAFTLFGDATEKFTQNWNKDGGYTTWSLDVSSGPVSCSPEEIDYLGKPVQVSGTFKTSGGGKGENPYWYPPFLHDGI